jgi:glycosyltransferase involved in cell wall biosynthesis
MPSRFLETFGLTALESLASGTPVIGFCKGWLMSFIPKSLSLDRIKPIDSLIKILKKELMSDSPVKNVSSYAQIQWKTKLYALMGSADQWILLLHDYAEKIGGAEYYLSYVEETLDSLSYDVSRFGYERKTTPWKRRWMFIFSLFAFYRGVRLTQLLSQKQPKIIWMHSVQRYIGYWWMRAVMNYSKKHDVKIYLSHHDVGLIAAFPQDITEESGIPKDPSLRAFIWGFSFLRKNIARVKWLYIKFLWKNLPKNTEHIIFAPFLEDHIRAHFPDQQIHILPHSYDETIFHS